MTLERFFLAHASVIHVRLVQVHGSSPREVGADMFVSESGLHGTIGGGQLEYMAIDKARALLRAKDDTAQMDVPLGPNIGQCCGGRVQLHLTRLSPAAQAEAVQAAQARRARDPHVYVLGAGHVGRALATFLQTLPIRCILIDSRPEELALCDADVDKRLSAMPEADIAAAPPGSAFVVLTHDHALDFLLTAQALKRTDAAYVGLIGSTSKRARFLRFCRDEEPALSTAPLICPIGATGSHDKRPEVIAAFVAAEILTRLTTIQAKKKTTAQ